jgi:1-acyl-sn-glycerol-3-phosphate acyltransferase
MDHNEKQNSTFQSVTLPLMRGLGWVLMTLLGPFRRFGVYRVPKTGGVLVLSNHQADIDPVVVQMACKRPIYFMAKSELFEMKGVRYILKLFRAFSVKRGEPDRTSIKHAVSLLKEGEAVCIFPEGELSPNGELLPLKPGIALVIRMAQVPVICLGIDGSRRVMPYGSLIPRPALHTIKATWGEVHQFAKDANTEEILAWVDAQLRSCLML